MKELRKQLLSMIKYELDDYIIDKGYNIKLDYIISNGNIDIYIIDDVKVVSENNNIVNYDSLKHVSHIDKDLFLLFIVRYDNEIKKVKDNIEDYLLYRDSKVYRIRSKKFTGDHNMIRGSITYSGYIPRHEKGCEESDINR